MFLIISSQRPAKTIRTTQHHFTISHAKIQYPREIDFTLKLKHYYKETI